MSLLHVNYELFIPNYIISFCVRILSVNPPSITYHLLQL